MQLLDKRRHLVPLTLGPEAVELGFQAELGEGDPGRHRRSVPVLSALSGHDGSDCGLQHKPMSDPCACRACARLPDLLQRNRSLGLFVCLFVCWVYVQGPCAERTSSFQ